MIPAQKVTKPMMNADRFTEKSCAFYEEKEMLEWRGGFAVGFPICWCSHHESRCAGCKIYKNRLEMF